MTSVELRCPVTPRRLFAKFLSGEAVPVEGNLIEVACAECGRAVQSISGVRMQVLHRFNLLGEVVETVQKARPPAP